MPHSWLKPKKRALRQTLIIGLATILLLSSIHFVGKLGNLAHVLAAPVQDDTAGTWTDSYSDSTGIDSSFQAGANVGSIQLKNGSNGFTAPYQTSGYVITSTIHPLLLARWGSLSWNATVPANTTVKLQVLDENNNVFSDSLLGGNSAGFASSPVDLSGLSILLTANSTGDAKYGRIRFKLLLTTSDTSVTPSIQDLSFSWTKTQGDLSAQGLLSSNWSAPDGNARATRQSQSSTSPAYLAFHWKKDLGVDGNGEFIQGTGDTLYLKTSGGIISIPSVTESQLLALNRNNGTVYWQKLLSGSFFTDNDIAISQNNSLYLSDIFGDAVTAFTGETGAPKWLYQFPTGGHGNSNVMVAPDGTIYTIRQPADNSTFTVYAYNPNGSVKWTYSEDPANNVMASRISLAADGTVYFGTSDYTGSTVYNNTGMLYALNPSDGTLKWTYAAGDIMHTTPLVDSDGTIYVANSEDPTIDKKIMAINPNGTLKWAYDFGVSAQRYFRLALGKDNSLFADRGSTYPSTSAAVDLIDKRTGTFIKSINFSSMEDIYYGDLITDKAGGFFINASVYQVSSAIAHYNLSMDKTWELAFSHPGTTNRIGFAMQDDLGRIYTTYSTGNSSHSDLIALYPWNLNVSTDKNKYLPGETITFSVTSSMATTNLITGDANKVQVLLQNGAKIPLSYDHQDGSQNTIWTGTYTVPDNGFVDNNYSYTVQASSAGITTNIPVNFDTPATNSSNTGIIATGNYTVDGSVPHLSLNDPGYYSTSSTVSLSGVFADYPAGIRSVSVSGGGQTVFANLSGDTWQATLGPFSDGPVTFSATATDDVGHTTTLVNRHPTIIDTIKPSLEVKLSEKVSHDSTLITGKALDATSGVASFVINEQTINVSSDGSFSYTLPLEIGDNLLVFTLRDQAGNQTVVLKTIRRYQFIGDAGGSLKELEFVDENGSLFKTAQGVVLTALRFGRGQTIKERAIIRTFQEQLKRLGYFFTKPTGFFGTITRGAVISFQSTHKLLADGLVDMRVLARLNKISVSDPDYIAPLTKGQTGFKQVELESAAVAQLKVDLPANSHGAEVSILQQKLYLLAYYTGPIRGLIDKTTQEAINAYRASLGLVKGTVDFNVRESLNHL